MWVSTSTFTDSMGSIQELENLLRLKDDKIRELQRLVEDKEDKIQALRSKLDKFQSILPQTSIIGGPRKQRAQGISAEPQALRSIQDLAKQSFKKHSKTNR